MSVELGKYGVWRQWHRLTPDLVRQIEDAGFGTLWVGSSPAGDLATIEEFLKATSRMTVATSIVNMWRDDPAIVAASYHRVVAKYPDRFLLGVGIGHPEQTEIYKSPYQTIVDYLDGLDAGGVPVDGRILAALGMKVLRLASERTAGAIPYLVNPEHTRRARAIMGPAALLAPEHKVVLEADPERARRIGRPPIKDPYLGLTNYVSNLRRLGYTDDDLSGGGSDRLIDDLALHGTADEIAKQLREHLDAGADHVALQLLTEPGADPGPAYRELAAALLP